MDAEAATRFSIIKGLAFVGITTSLLFLTLLFLPGPREREEPINQRRMGLPLLIAVAALVVAIGLISFVSYRSQLDSSKQDELENLQAVARLKVVGISQWLNERRKDAEAIARDIPLHSSWQQWQGTDSSEARDELLRTMRQSRASHGFARITLIDGSGKIRMATNPDRHVSIDLAGIARLAKSEGRTIFVDLYREARDSIVHLAFAVPLREKGQAASSDAHVMVFDLRANDFLNPYLAIWPMPGRQGELVLWRVENGMAVMLNVQPNQPDTALTVSVPSSEIDTPIFRYHLKGEHLIDGVDYRGEPVLAAGLSIPRTDWVLIAKMKRDVALGGVRSRTMVVSLAIVSGLIALIAFIAYLWQSRRLHAALSAMSNRQASEIAAAKFRDTFEQAAIGIAHLSLDGKVLQCNAEYRRILGQPEGTLENGGIAAIALPENLAEDLAILGKFARGEINLFNGERRYLRTDSDEVWVDISTSLVRNRDGEPDYLIDVITDITGRKHAEAHMQQADAVFRNAQEGIVITRPDGRIVRVNPAFCRITGYEREELIDQNMRILQSGQYSREFYHRMWSSIAENGYWQGEIWNRRKNGEPYPEFLTISSIKNDHGEIVNYVGTFADITSIKQSESQLIHLAHHDPLTNLPNRLLLSSRLSHAVARAHRTGAIGAVLFLDLDRFKNVNDSLGHPAGDELLLAVAKRLGSRIRESDTLARLGGDEFVVLAEDIAEPAQVASLAQSLIDQFERPFHLTGGHEVYIGTSIGISLFPEDGAHADEIIKHADAALYRAKEEGRGIYRFYTTALTDKANARLDLERRLRRALERDEFELHYQPLIEVDTLRVVGVEALLRWREPGNGMISPATFISLTEETGIILPLGERIMRLACRQMKTWLDEGRQLTTMAVNLSPRQFHLPDLPELIAAILAETGLPAEHLELELTEGALIDFGVGAEVKLTALRELGVRVSIDDFGTGYSSLAYLKRFPINALKVDGSFVRDIPDDPADMEITAAIIGLARTLRLHVVAECVETEAQLSFLREQGCQLAQGYLFSRPLPAAELGRFLDRTTNGIRPLATSGSFQTAR
ncbi:MAG: EAL domain-containing protein [Rhodospirillaceae bacterium]|nr:EAL domain-containing protein [Rhodospirillaceae bacterium]